MNDDLRDLGDRDDLSSRETRRQRNQVQILHGINYPDDDGFRIGTFDGRLERANVSNLKKKHI